jgi:hypothetical protein
MAEAGAAEDVAHGGAGRDGHGCEQREDYEERGGTAHGSLKLDYGFKVAVGIPSDSFS